MDKSKKDSEFITDWRINNELRELLNHIALILAEEYVEELIKEQNKDD